MDVALHSNFADPGVTVADNYDAAANITTSVLGLLDVDTSILGVSYTIEYLATDLSGNRASARRVVTIAPKQWRGFCHSTEYPNLMGPLRAMLPR
jgi:hypothetical protein